VKSIASGDEHSCALISDGTVMCWGKNEFGQLGDGTTENRDSPVIVQGLARVKELTAGWGHTCALTVAGAVRCWGYNQNGELGNGRTDNSSRPADVSRFSSGATAIAAGDDHTCATTEDGAVLCWGWNASGQLGNGTADSISVPSAVQGLSGKAVAVAAGWGHTCALTAEGGVQCWGANESGQLGNNSAAASAAKPVRVTGMGKGAESLTAKGGHSCVRMETGAVMCWGDNTYGQLGDGTAVDRRVPVAVTGLMKNVSAVAAGGNHTCAIVDKGGVMCWGWNFYGQLGDRSTTSQAKPVAAAELPGTAVALGLGLRHSCAVVDPGLIICWGADEFGQAWSGWLVEPAFPYTTPTAALRSSEIHREPIGAGGYHNCAVTTNGFVVCWGHNNNGQLGEGFHNLDEPEGSVVALDGEAVGVACGGFHSCALMSDGAVFCWGSNQNGQLGDGTRSDHSLPTPAAGLPGSVVDLAAGGGSTCAALMDGVLCWGSYFNDPSEESGGRKISISGLPSEVRELSALQDHFCVLTDAGGGILLGCEQPRSVGERKYRVRGRGGSGIRAGNRRRLHCFGRGAFLCGHIQGEGDVLG
jgi:alpha-tubulin suppressor-like RCC1 family protein